MTVSKTYRLDETIVAELEEYCDENGYSPRTVVEKALFSYLYDVRQVFDKKEEQPKSKTSDVSDDVLSILAKQLEEKDKQIESLTKLAQASQETLQSAHESLKAAQVLNAADKPQMALENIVQKEERKGFFQRLFGK